MPLFILSLINGLVFIAGIVVSLSITNNFSNNLVSAMIWMLVTLAVIMLIPYMVSYTLEQKKDKEESKILNEYINTWVEGVKSDKEYLKTKFEGVCVIAFFFVVGWIMAIAIVACAVSWVDYFRSLIIFPAIIVIVFMIMPTKKTPDDPDQHSGEGINVSTEEHKAEEP